MLILPNIDSSWFPGKGLLALSSYDSSDPDVICWLEEVTAGEGKALQDQGRWHEEAWGGTFHVSGKSLKSRFLTHHPVISIRPMLPIFCLWEAACLRGVRNISSPEALLFSPFAGKKRHFLSLVCRALHKLDPNSLQNHFPLLQSTSLLQQLNWSI